jgi:hypothetical protein
MRQNYGICPKENLNDINLIVVPFRNEVEHSKVNEIIKGIVLYE